MTRKQLVQGLRALHEDDVIENIKYLPRRHCVTVQYTTNKDGRDGQLIITYATERKLQTKPK